MPRRDPPGPAAEEVSRRRPAIIALQTVLFVIRSRLGTLHWDLLACPASPGMLKRDRSPSDAGQRERERARRDDVAAHPYACEIFNFDLRLKDLKRLRRSYETRLAEERERIASICTHRYHGDGFHQSINADGSRRHRRCALCRKWEICNPATGLQLPPTVAEQRGVKRLLGLGLPMVPAHASDSYDAELRELWVQGHPWVRMIKVSGGNGHRTQRVPAPPIDHRRAAGIEPPNTP